MTSIATLGIAVTTQGVKEAERDLDKLQSTGAKAEQSLGRLGDKAQATGKKFSSTAIREQRQELSLLIGQIDPTVAALGRLDAQEAKLRQFRGKGLIDTESFNTYSAKIAASRTALSQFGQTADKTGLSAKQLAFATRGLPAQFTDIAVALQSGQRPLQVFLQQGGQLKDMFGGIGPAARALGSYVLGLINPFTIAAAVVGGLAFAMNKVEDETAGFASALARTGDFAGRSVTQLHDMADALNRIAFVSRGDAVDALTQVAASGRFAGESFDLVAKAAARMKASAGQDIQDTVSAFKQLANDPLDALLRLNDAEHFLTQSQLDRVKAMVDEGRQQDAVSEAVRIYAGHLDDVANKSEAAMPEMTKRWAALKDNIGNATSALGEYIARLDAALQRQGSFLHGLQAVSEATNIYAKLFGAAQRALFTPNNAPSTQKGAGSATPSTGGWSFAAASGGSFGRGAAVDSQDARARIAAEKEFGRIVESNLDKRQKLESEIANIRKVGLAAGKSEAEVDKQIAAARARYEESLPKGRKPRGDSASSISNASDRFDDMTGRYRAELQGPLQKAEEDHLRAMREITQAAEKGKRSHEDLADALKLEGQAYEKTRASIQAQYDDEIARLSGPVAQAEQNHIDALRRIDELKQQVTLTGEQYTRMLDEEAKAYEQDKAAAQRAADPLNALLDDMRFELDTIGKSNAERAVMNELRRQGIDVMSQEAQGALGVAKAYEAEAEAKQRSIDLMDTFRRSFSDNLTDFVTGAKSAKEAFKDFFDTIAKAITQAISQKLVQKLFGTEGQSGGGQYGGLIQSIFGSLFGGGRAMGGPVSSGRIYEVGEVGPEIYEANGRNFMIPPRSGNVVPLRAGASGARGDVTVNQSIYVQGSVDPRTRDQLRTDTAREQRRAIARNN